MNPYSDVGYLFFSTSDLSAQSLYIEGYGVTTIGALGIILNVIGIVDLLQRKNRKIFFNLLLASQLVFDSLLLATFLTKSVFTHFLGIPNEQFIFYYLILCPLIRFSICGTIFMTVTLAYSRTNAVEKPLQNRNSNFSQSERIQHLLKHVLPSFFASIILTIPWFWEYEVQYNFKTASGTPILLASDIRLDPIYSLTFVATFSLLLISVLPTLAIIVLSLRIYRRIRQSFSSTAGDNTRTRVFNNKNHTNKIVILIAVFFLIFRIPRMLLTIMEIVIQILNLNKIDIANAMGCYAREWISLLNFVNDFFQVLNSATHVFMYKGVSMFKSRSNEPNDLRTNV